MSNDLEENPKGECVWSGAASYGVGVGELRLSIGFPPALFFFASFLFAPFIIILLSSPANPDSYMIQHSRQICLKISPHSKPWTFFQSLF